MLLKRAARGQLALIPAVQATMRQNSNEIHSSVSADEEARLVHHAKQIALLIPDVYRMLKARHESHGCPTDGWVFPSTAREGHLEQGTAKTQHSASIARVNDKTLKANVKREIAGEKLLLPCPS